MHRVIETFARPDLFREAAFLNGQWHSGGQFCDIFNPANGEYIGRVPNFGAKETQEAITSAERALLSWREKTAGERGAILQTWAKLMLQYEEDLAQLMTLEQGKPLAEARGEVRYAASFLQWFGEEARRVYGETIPAPQANTRIFVLKQPIGVCAAITPWNFPAAMITRKVGPALAAGCTMIVKPAPQTPFSALALAVLAQEAGVPDGVLQVITGDAVAIGQVLTQSDVVRKLSFTGSTQTGRLLMRESAATLKKLSLELGGNAPFIVFEDADLDAAALGALQSKFRNAGQTCVCVNRFLVHESVYEAFAEKLGKLIQTLNVGDGFAAQTTQGPLIDAQAVAKVERHLADATEKGAQILLGGHRVALDGGDVTNSQFFAPTLLVNANASMLLAKEETFGPVAALFKFSNEQEAISMANDTEFGLAAYFYTQNLSRAFRVAERLEYGMVGLNTGLISNEVAPFGGIKSSGLGREGSHFGIDEYLEIKYLALSGIE